MMDDVCLVMSHIMLYSIGSKLFDKENACIQKSQTV